MNNNVLGTLKYDITAGAAALVVTPLAGTSFNLPPGGTDATGATTGGIATFGKPVEPLLLVDRLDASQAKYEIIYATVRAPEAGGAYTHTVATSGRGAEGTTAQAWTAGALVYQLLTAAALDLLASGHAMRAQALMTHKETGNLSWDGTSFKFVNFRILGAGRGAHASSGGFMEIAMPANGTVATGYGGAVNCVAASGGWPLLASTALYYEPNLNGGFSSVAGNFKCVSWSADFVVPPHWILVAARPDNSGGQDNTLRLGNGATLPYWHPVGGTLEPAFQNSWVNYGGAYQVAQFSKSDDGVVTLRGLIKNGTATTGTLIFTLPAGFRPAAGEIFIVESNDAFGAIGLDNTGQMLIRVASSAYLSLSGIRFQAA